MRQLHMAMKENHHLKHFGRLQYGLFIKVDNNFVQCTTELLPIINCRT